MNTRVSYAEAQLARRVLLEREARNWSLADLAAQSGVSKAAISKIERGVASPTAGVLVRLAEAFDLTFAGLLLLAEDSPKVQRRGDAPTWTDPATGYIRRQIYNHPEHPVEIVEVSLPAQALVTMPAASYARIRQVVTVTNGQLRLQEGSNIHNLDAGDSIGFGPPTEVTFSNVTAEPCTYLVTLSRS